MHNITTIKDSISIGTHLPQQPLKQFDWIYVKRKESAYEKAMITEVSTHEDYLDYKCLIFGEDRSPFSQTIESDSDVHVFVKAFTSCEIDKMLKDHCYEFRIEKELLTLYSKSAMIQTKGDSPFKVKVDALVLLLNSQGI